MFKSDELEDRILSLDTVDSIALDSIPSTISIKLNNPITLRKEFPETWIWENINDQGFVIKSNFLVLTLCGCKVFNSFICVLTG